MLGLTGCLRGLHFLETSPLWTSPNRGGCLSGRIFLCPRNHGIKYNKLSQDACCLQSTVLNSVGCKRKHALGTHHVEGRQTHWAKASKRFKHKVLGHREEDTDLPFGQTVYTSRITLTTKIQHLALHCTALPSTILKQHWPHKHCLEKRGAGYGG